jgi:hypothetical protein
VASSRANVPTRNVDDRKEPCLRLPMPMSVAFRRKAHRVAPRGRGWGRYTAPSVFHSPC